MERHAAGDNVAVRTKRKEEKRERRDSKTNAAAAENWSSRESEMPWMLRQVWRRCERRRREKERANDRTARLSPLKQFVSAVHRNWSGNTAATVSNTLRPCVLSRIPCSSLSIPLSTDSTTFNGNHHYHRQHRIRASALTMRTPVVRRRRSWRLRAARWSPGILVLDGISRLWGKLIASCW